MANSLFVESYDNLVTRTVVVHVRDHQWLTGRMSILGPSVNVLVSRSVWICGQMKDVNAAVNWPGYLVLGRLSRAVSDVGRACVLLDSGWLDVTIRTWHVKTLQLQLGFSQRKTTLLYSITSVQAPEVLNPISLAHIECHCACSLDILGL